MTKDQATRRFYELVWPQRAAVLRNARILIGNNAEADDLVQETLIKAFKKIETFRDGTDVRSWLITIFRNTRVDRLRSTTAHPTVSLEELDLETPAPESQEPYPAENVQPTLDAFSDQQIIDVMKRLPEEIRWTLLLVDVEQLSQQETSEILDVPLGTIKSRVHRGHLMVRDWLLPIARERRLVRD